MTDRIPNSEDRRPRPDWWARLFAVGGLAAGAAALYYSWIHTANLPSTQEIVSSYHAEIDQFLEEARLKLDEQDRLEAVARKDRNDLEWEAIKERDAKFAQRLAELSKPDAAAVGQVAGEQVEASTDMVAAASGGEPSTDTDSGDTLAAKDGQTTSSSEAEDSLIEDLFGTGDVAGAGEARLQVARRTLQPTSAADAEIVTISNTTELDADLRAIQFAPDSLYEVNSDLSSDTTTLGAGDLDIQFVRMDNRARDPSKQGTYRRVFANPITIPAGGRPDVRVQIQNGQHLGWGLRGTLVLDYGDRQLEIPGVSARFVAER